jgi:hypothetical protein
MTRIFSSIIAVTIASLLFAGLMPAKADAQLSVGVGISVGSAPPPIPYYAQPPVPGPGYIWQPGYWAWGPYGYYWVPGTWVAAPSIGLYWTPGYWAFVGGVYSWDPGYWGPSIGFYGGINYGYGYYGSGYVGGSWRSGHFWYNRAVSNVNINVAGRYAYSNRTVVRSWNNRVAYNGGPHGIAARATAVQQRAYSQRRMGMTSAQQQHAAYAQRDPASRYSTNHGNPAVAAARTPYSAHNTPAQVRSNPSRTVTESHARTTGYQPHTEAHPAAAPAHAAPAHAAPAYHAPAAHPAAPAHAAPAYHAPAHAAPAYHAPARPAYHAPARPAAPAYHPAARPAMPAAHPAPAHPAPAAPRPRGSMRP